MFAIAAARTHREEVVSALLAFPEQVTATLARLDKLNPDFVARTIGQLMILPEYEDLADKSLALTRELLSEVVDRATA